MVSFPCLVLYNKTLWSSVAFNHSSLLNWKQQGDLNFIYYVEKRMYIWSSTPTLKVIKSSCVSVFNLFFGITKSLCLFTLFPPELLLKELSHLHTSLNIFTPCNTAWLTQWSPELRLMVHSSRRSQKYGAKVSKQPQPFPGSSERKCPESKLSSSKTNIIDSGIIVIIPAAFVQSLCSKTRGKVVLEFSHISSLLSKKGQMFISKSPKESLQHKMCRRAFFCLFLFCVLRAWNFCKSYFAIRVVLHYSVLPKWWSVTVKACV